MGKARRGFGQLVAFGLIGFGIVVSDIGLAGEAGRGSKIWNQRDDLSVPAHCRTVEMSDFSRPEIDLFTMGIKGGRKNGFDREYPMSRKNARILWEYVKEHPNPKGQTPKRIKENPELKRDYEQLVQNYETMDFDFNSEGDVLELLGILALRAELGDSRFFVTGGIAYSGGLAGELDFVVARNTDCRVTAVGEAKLGRRIGKARQQLQRFQKFIEGEMSESVIFGSLFFDSQNIMGFGVSASAL